MYDTKGSVRCAGEAGMASPALQGRSVPSELPAVLVLSFYLNSVHGKNMLVLSFCIDKTAGLFGKKNS